jgi:hypothetical protein
LFGEDRVGAAPQLFGNDGLDLGIDPLAFGLEAPVLRSVGSLGVVGAMVALGRLVAQQPVHGRIGELGAVAGAVAPLIQEPSDRLLALMLDEQLVDQGTDRRFVRIGLELFVDPAIAERGSAPERLPQLGPDRHGSLDAISDLLSLPARHCGDHREEQPARR